jgi:hypothetical protein
VASEALRRQAIALHELERRPSPPWEKLRRVQQQLLTWLLMRGIEEGRAAMTFSPTDMVEWYGVSATTAREWLSQWRSEAFVVPVKADAQRIRNYSLSEYWMELLDNVLVNARDSARDSTSVSAS